MVQGARNNLGWPIEAILGRDESVVPFHKFGRITDISTTVFETIWRQGGLINYPVAATILNVSSDNAADDKDAGSGARTIVITGLDENGDLATETISLDGTTIVTTTTAFLRAFRVETLTTGTPRIPNTGTIYVYEGTATLGVPDDSTKIYATVEPGDGQSLQAAVTVPRGFTGVLQRLLWTSNAAANKEIDLRIIMRKLDQADAPFNTKDYFNLAESNLEHVIQSLQNVPELTDIEMQVKADQVSTNASGTMDILFVR